MENVFSITSLEEIFTSMPGGFFVYKAGGDEEIIYANKAMQRIFKCGSDEEFRKLVGNSFRGIVHPDDYEKVNASIGQQIAVNPYSLDYVEYRIIRSDGSVRWVEDYGHFVKTEEYGDVFYVFIEDATERMKKRIKELERVNSELESIQARESQYRKAILSNALTYFEINLSKDEFISVAGGSESGGFRFDGIEKSTKYSEYVKHWISHTNEDTLEDYRRFFNVERLIGCYNSGELEQVLETYATDDSGKTRLLQYIILLGKNKFSGDIIALSIMNDITGMAEKQRMFQAALSEANTENIASKTFIKNITHSIRPLLNTMMSFTGMIGFNSSDPEMVDYCVGKVKSSGKEIFEIINAAMTAFDETAGEKPLGSPYCDLSDLLDDIRIRTLSAASGKNIRFTMDRSGIKNFSVYADTVHIDEILWQLLDNALKFTGKGGSVTLRASESESETEGCGIYTFVVEDNGQGIDEEYLDKIFEPHIRVGGEIQGKGWGLALVKKLAEMMNGTAAVESGKDAGSSFTVTLELRRHTGD